MTSPAWMLEVTPGRFDNDIFPFWEGLKRREFLLHRCTRCSAHYWPMTVCPRCEDSKLHEMAWSPASGKGTVFSFGVVHRAAKPAFRSEVPYAVALVETLEGPLFPTRLLGRPGPELKVGLPVEISYHDVPETGMTLPLFKMSG